MILLNSWRSDHIRSPLSDGWRMHLGEWDTGLHRSEKQRIFPARADPNAVKTNWVLPTVCGTGRTRLPAFRKLTHWSNRMKHGFHRKDWYQVQMVVARHNRTGLAPAPAIPTREIISTSSARPNSGQRPTRSGNHAQAFAMALHLKTDQ